MPITISKAALSKSLREVRDAAREQGRAEGRAEAARMLEFAISLNGHGPATVKALREGINPAVRTSPEADPEDDRQPNTLDAATLAYLDALIDAKTHHADSDGGDVAAVLRGLIEDPAALEAALGGDVLMKAAQHAPKGGVSVGGKEYSGGEFIPAEVMANATPEEKAAVEGGGKPAKKKWTMPVSELREYADQDLATHITATGVSTWVSKITDDMLKDGGSGLGEETRWMYDQTQKRLKKAGIKSRDLFRSMYLDADGVDRLFDGDAINLSRMASWTDNPDTALQFLGNSNANGRAEVVISCPGVPASRILASHDTWDVFQRVAEEREFGAEDETIAAAGRFSEYTIEVNGSPVSSKEELKQAIASGRESGDPPIVDIIIGKSPTMLKAFDASKHPRGDDGRFIGREAIHAAKSDPALAEKLREKTTDPEERKKLDAALAGEADLGRTKAGLHKEKVAATKQEKAERLQKVRTLAEEISMARRGGEPVPPEHFTELADHLPHLTVQQLRSVRESLAASFWGRRRRDEMVTALVRHAKVMAERKRAEQEATDALDFGMEAMSNTGGTGHADAGRSDLNPWREFDADKNYGEAQHGGRMFQRHKLMAELPESDKTSHGTPDTGSILKQRGDVEPPPTQPGAATPVPSPTPSGSSPESPPPEPTLEDELEDQSDIENNLPPENAQDKAKAESIANALREAVVDTSGGDTKDWCVTTAEAVKSVYPDAEVWSGGYEGFLDDQAHTIVKIGGYFIDVTADQFGGPEVVVSRELDDNLYPDFKAREVKFDPKNATGPMKRIAEKLKKQLAKRGHSDLAPNPSGSASTPVTPDKPEGGAATPYKDATTAHAAADEYAKEAKRIANAPGGNPDAAIAYGEAANALRQVAKTHEAIDAEKAKQAEPAKRVAEANAKVDTAHGAVDAARAKEEAAKARLAELQAGGDPAERIARAKAELAAMKQGKGGTSSDVPKDHAAALSKSRTHHNRRTDTKGTPIGRHVVYRDKAGKVNAVPAASYMGKELLAGRQNQYTVEGQYDFGPDGNPVKVSDSGPTGHQPEKSKGHVAFVNGMEYYKDAAGNLLRADAKLPIDTQGTRFGRFEATPAMADMRIKMLTGSQPEQNRPAVSEPDIKDTHQYTRKEYLGSEYDKEAIRRIGKEHKDAVEAAIATGKPVPPEVLADYPDLAAKYGPIRKSVASGSASDWDSLRAELLQDDAPPG